jgi:hypothetical protein
MFLPNIVFVDQPSSLVVTDTTCPIPVLEYSLVEVSVKLERPARLAMVLCKNLFMFQLS